MIKKQLIGILFYDEKNKVTKEKTGRKMAMCWLTDQEISSDRGCGHSIKSKVCLAEVVPVGIKPGFVEINCDWNGNITEMRQVYAKKE